jgi:flagellar protein FlaG
LLRCGGKPRTIGAKTIPPSAEKRRLVRVVPARRGQTVIQAIGNLSATEGLPARTAASETSKSATASKPAATNAPPADAREADAEKVQEAIVRINRTVQSLVTHLEFAIDTDTNRSVVKVIDNRTQEILRQFPSEEVLQIARALDNFTGLLLKDQA